MHATGGNDIEFLFDWSDHDCIVKRSLKFDFYITDLGILIEYDGIQHYVPSDFWGGIKAFKKLQEYDSIKINGLMKMDLSWLELDMVRI